MRRAIDLAAATSPRGPNPRVGCVLLDSAGDVVASGVHLGAGTAHAEVAAIAAAGRDVRGCTAVVSLEPCTHTGRTGPCTSALLEAGISRVVIAQSDPNPIAGGGAGALAAAGVEVETGVLAAEAQEVNLRWSAAVRRGRPWVIWKVAATLDGRVAALDGTARWITSPESRVDVHRLRAQVDAVAVGTGTALTDRPRLTARDADGVPLPQQPLRVVVGLRTLPEGHPLLEGDVLHLRTRDPGAVVAELAGREVRTMLLEGGPELTGAFWRAGLIDEVHWYVAPALLGAGSPAVVELGITTIAAAARLRVLELVRVGVDAKIVAMVDASEDR